MQSFKPARQLILSVRPWRGGSRMGLVQWVVASALAGLWLLLALYNGQLAWQQFVRRRDDGRGLAPVFGGLFGAGAVMLAPVGTAQDRIVFAWLPVVLDFGCLPYLLLCLFPR
jgi:hypothetical protein